MLVLVVAFVVVVPLLVVVVVPLVVVVAVLVVVAPVVDVVSRLPLAQCSQGVSRELPQVLTPAYQDPEA